MITLITNFLTKTLTILIYECLVAYVTLIFLFLTNFPLTPLLAFSSDIHPVIVVQQLCLFMHDPKEPHLAALKRVLDCVRGTTTYFSYTPIHLQILLLIVMLIGLVALLREVLLLATVCFSVTTCYLGLPNVRVPPPNKVLKLNINVMPQNSYQSTIPKS